MPCINNLPGRAESWVWLHKICPNNFWSWQLGCTSEPGRGQAYGWQNTVQEKHTMDYIKFLSTQTSQSQNNNPYDKGLH